MDTKKNEENVVESKTPLKRGRRSVAEEAMVRDLSPYILSISGVCSAHRNNFKFDT